MSAVIVNRRTTWSYLILEVIIWRIISHVPLEIPKDVISQLYPRKLGALRIFDHKVFNVDVKKKSIS